MNFGFFCKRCFACIIEECIFSKKLAGVSLTLEVTVVSLSCLSKKDSWVKIYPQ